MKHVWLAIPAYTGQIHLGSMRAILADLLALRARGDDVEIYDESGNAMIGDCRGIIVSHFLASKATDLVFIDSDVLWEKGTLLKLLDAPVDCVAAIYPQRRDPIAFSVAWQPKDELHADPETGLLEVDGVPAGCLRCSRAMLERMVEAYADLEFIAEGAPNDTAWDLFGPYRIGKAKLGEDYAFCRRWRDLGGKVWIDPEILMGHVGFKTFRGHIGHWLRSPR